MGDSFNELIDNLLAASDRLTGLPLVIILAGLMITAIAVFFVLWLIRKRKIISLLPWFTLIAFVLLIFLISVFADIKIRNLKQEINGLRTQVQSEIWQGMNKGFSETKTDINTDSIKKQLVPLLGELDIQSVRINFSTVVYTIITEEPSVRIFLSVTNLNDTNLRIVVSPVFKEKYLTSYFADSASCFLAINGEAGTTPSLGCPLGQWTGNWISDGKTVLLEDSDIRPFLSFDKNNKALFFPESIIDKTNSPEKFNTIWGRYDILINGINLKKDQGGRQPRTIMGINATGDQLFLMVVDGRQPGYSMGIELEQAASVIKVFGASDAMCCDQGGSSCMYIKQMGGIVNQPSDGRERPVYSHFGLAVK